jgi:hypothetical protein
MSLDIASLLLNFLIIGLLMATISYCWVLNKRIKILQDGKSELANLLKYFDESTTRASESIVALQTASKKIGENIQARIDKVNYLMDDLAFMIEKGNRLANQLDANFAVNRARNRVIAEDNTPDGLEETVNSEKISPKSSFTKEYQPQPKTVEKISTKEKTAASLEAVLDRVIGRTKPANLNDHSEIVEKPSAPNRSKAASSARSKAEKELLDMIRAGIKG